VVRAIAVIATLLLGTDVIEMIQPVRLAVTRAGMALSSPPPAML
jgi:hypothetical protein